MQRIQPTEFYLMGLLNRSDRKPFCFDKCIKRQQITMELTREQQKCLGSCLQKYKQALKYL